MLKDIWTYLLIAGLALTALSTIKIKLNETREKIERVKSEKADKIKRDEQYAIIKNLKLSNEELLNKLNPIVELAKQRFPKMSEYEALNKLREEFLSLQKRTLDLENKAKPRQVDTSRIGFKKNYFENCQGCRIDLEASTSSSEANQLAQQLLPLFKKSGLIVNDPVNGFMSPDGHTGVIIYMDNLDSNFAKALAMFFNDIKVKAEFILVQPTHPNFATIQVWPKE